jgi:SAM-dependent methyltransferase
MDAPSPTKERNILRREDRAFHDWYRFVLSYPPHLVRDYLQRFRVKAAHQVLDPFCGTGTTLVECKKLGISSIGLEANPVAHFASRVKTDWALDPHILMQAAQEIARQVRSSLWAEGINDDAMGVFHDVSFVRLPELRRLTAEAEALLLTNSISPLPLHKALILKEALDAAFTSPSSEHMRLAFATALVNSISNLHFGPEIGVRTIKDDAPVIQPWLQAVRMMVADLEEQAAQPSPSTNVYLADARYADDVLEDASIDAVITSPPYPNEKDYTRTTRLESVFLGFMQDRQDLRRYKQQLLRSNTRNVYAADEDEQWIEDNDEIQELAHRIEQRRIELGKTSGFERLYARTTRLYFGGMARHLSGLRRALRPGAQLAYVVGDQASYFQIMIRTGSLLAKVAARLGYEVVGIDLFRTRLATATRQQLREEVVILRWNS